MASFLKNLIERSSSLEAIPISRILLLKSLVKAKTEQGVDQHQ